MISMQEFISLQDAHLCHQGKWFKQAVSSLRTEAGPALLTLVFPALHSSVSIYANSIICMGWMNKHETIQSFWICYAPPKCRALLILSIYTQLIPTIVC